MFFFFNCYICIPVPTSDIFQLKDVDCKPFIVQFKDCKYSRRYIKSFIWHINTLIDKDYDFLWGNLSNYMSQSFRPNTTSSKQVYLTPVNFITLVCGFFSKGISIQWKDTQLVKDVLKTCKLIFKYLSIHLRLTRGGIDTNWVKMHSVKNIRLYEETIWKFLIILWVYYIINVIMVSAFILFFSI